MKRLTWCFVAGAALLSSNASQAMGCVANATEWVCDGTSFDITINIADNPDLPLFGDPILTGDTLSFSPTNFDAEDPTAVNTDSQITRGVIKLNLIPDAGQRIDEVAVNESGDYALTSFGTSLTRSQVFGSLRTQVKSPIGDPNASLETFVEKVFVDGDDGFITIFGDDADVADDWMMGTLIGDGSVSNDGALWEDVTGFGDIVELQIENDLSADAISLEGGSATAFIAKKDSTVELTVSTVPVPAAVWLVMPALGFLSTKIRRRA